MRVAVANRASYESSSEARTTTSFPSGSKNLHAKFELDKNPLPRTVTTVPPSNGPRAPRALAAGARDVSTELTLGAAPLASYVKSIFAAFAIGVANVPSPSPPAATRSSNRSPPSFDART